MLAIFQREKFDALRRLYWWSGMRADVWRFCCGCLNCASRKGPGHGICPLLQPIPVCGPFHCMGVDILKLPLWTPLSCGVSQPHKMGWGVSSTWPAGRDLLVENIVCKHGLPEELLSDCGANFLLDLILQMCSLLGIKEVNTSWYHSQTDGLVETVNCMYHHGYDLQEYRRNCCWMG